LGAPENHVLDGDPDPPWDGAILWGKGQPIVKYRDTVVICAKTVELTKMPFWIWTREGPRKDILGVDAHWLYLVNSGTIKPSIFA